MRTMETKEKKMKEEEKGEKSFNVESATNSEENKDAVENFRVSADLTPRNSLLLVEMFYYMKKSLDQNYQNQCTLVINHTMIINGFVVSLL